MISPRTAAKLRASREGQELIGHIRQSIQSLNIPVAQVEAAHPEGIATDVLSRKRAIAVLEEIFHDLTTQPPTDDLRQEREADAGMA